jgi:hypothetical protein
VGTAEDAKGRCVAVSKGPTRGAPRNEWGGYETNYHFVAGEVSADNHAVALMRSLRELTVLTSSLLPRRPCIKEEDTTEQFKVNLGAAVLGLISQEGGPWLFSRQFHTSPQEIGELFFLVGVLLLLWFQVLHLVRLQALHFSDKDNSHFTVPGMGLELDIKEWHSSTWCSAFSLKSSSNQR